MSERAYSNGHIIIDAGQIATRSACAYMQLHRPGIVANHDCNELDAGYCIDAPSRIPAGSTYCPDGLASVWESCTMRGVS